MATEAEAREKWCPFHKIKDDTPGWYEGKAMPTHMRCIASDCMAWRKEWTPEQMKARTDEWFKGKEWPEDIPREANGYCGLAGKP